MRTLLLLILIIVTSIAVCLLLQPAQAQWLPGVKVMKTKHVGRRIKPRVVVLHSTDSHLGLHRAARYLRRNRRKVAYHIIIERSGKVVQLASLNRKVNHAGRSKWRGKKNVNGFSIGVSLVGPGELRGSTRRARADSGQVFRTGLYRKRRGSKTYVWLKFTNAQKRSLRRVAAQINKRFPGIKYTSHGRITSRKIDQEPRGISLASLSRGAIYTLKSKPKLVRVAYRPAKVAHRTAKVAYKAPQRRVQPKTRRRGAAIPATVKHSLYGPTKRHTRKRWRRKHVRVARYTPAMRLAAKRRIYRKRVYRQRVARANWSRNFWQARLNSGLTRRRR